MIIMVVELSSEEEPEADWEALCETCGYEECNCPEGTCSCPRCKAREPTPVVEEVVTTPLMTAQEVVTLLSGETAGVRAAEIRGLIALTFPSELHLLEAVDMTDATLLSSIDR